jgi:hypothetical protein
MNSNYQIGQTVKINKNLGIGELGEIIDIKISRVEVKTENGIFTCSREHILGYSKQMDLDLIKAEIEDEYFILDEECEISNVRRHPDTVHFKDVILFENFGNPYSCQIFLGHVKNDSIEHA